jgi:hypothetical protein
MNIPNEVIDIIFTKYHNINNNIYLCNSINKEIKKRNKPYLNKLNRIKTLLKWYYNKWYSYKLAHTISAYTLADVEESLMYGHATHPPVMRFNSIITEALYILLTEYQRSVISFNTTLFPQIKRKSILVYKFIRSSSWYQPPTIVYPRRGIGVDAVYRTIGIMTRKIRKRPLVAALVY